LIVRQEARLRTLKDNTYSKKQTMRYGAKKMVSKIQQKKPLRITRCKLSQKEQLQMIGLFTLGETARSAADILKIQPNTSALFYRKLRELISIQLEQESNETFGENLFIDEKILTAHEDQDKYIVFAVFTKNGKVFTQMRSHGNRKNSSLIKPEALFCATGEHNLVIDVNDLCQEIISRDAENQVDAFWLRSKEILRKYNGIPKSNFLLFLKECEFRFNYGTHKKQLKIMEKWVTIKK
jgi:transposase